MSTPETGPITVPMLYRDIQATRELVENLIARADQPQREMIYEITGSFPLTAGAGYTTIFQVAGDFQATLSRLVLWPGGKTPGSTLSVSYVIVYEGDRNADFTDGQARDFAPPPVATSMTLPALFTDSDSHAWRYRGPTNVNVKVSGGASSPVVYFAAKLIVVQGSGS